MGRRSYSPARRQRSRSPRRRSRRDRYSRSRSPARRRGGRYNNYDNRDRRRGGYGGRDNYGGRRRGGGRRDRRHGRRSPSPDPLHQPLDKFRHPSISLEPPESDPEDSVKMSLEQEEIAYVFGRMGSTKDKLGRVSGTHIELRGSGLLIEGSSERIEKAKKYVRILLAQRHGIVDVDPRDHPGDLTLMQIPTDCKGFVTGRNGATLRQIERESATLMTFCRTEKDNEPLAIFGTRRGRLYAQLKIMSIVEGKHENWFVGKDGEKPDVEIIDADLEDDDWGVSWLKLEADMVGYALGRGGETRIKLEIASGCIIQYIGLWAAFAGRKDQQERGKTYLTWLLEQQNGHVSGQGSDRSEAKIMWKNRNDVKILWVPEDSVGYVTGVKAKTLRNLETKTGTFCFFDKSNMGRKKKEEMLIFSWKKEHRDAAAEEVYLIVDFHQRKTGGNQTVSEHPEESRSKSGSRSRSRSYSKRSRGSRSRSGSYSRSPSRSRSVSTKREK